MNSELLDDLNDMKKSYFYLNNFCLLVSGYKKSAIYNLLDSDIFWLDDKASYILKNMKSPINDIIENCKLKGINKDEVLNLFSELIELNIGTISDYKLFIDNIHNNFKKDSYNKDLVDLKRVSIRITNKCGLDCFFCNTNQNTICFPCARKSQDNDRTLSIRDLHGLIEDICLFNCPEVIFIGGDPFKEPENFMDVLKYTANRIKNTYVFTNLTTLSDYHVKELRSLSNVQLIIPLFSPDETSFKTICRKDNVLDRILTNISILRENQIKMSVLFFKTKRDFNNGSIFSLIKDSKDFSFLSPTPLLIEGIDFSHYSDGFIINNEDCFGIDLNSFFENNIYNVCLGRRITVDLNGDVKPCLHSGKSLGNIFEKRLNKILRSGIQDHLWYLNKDRIETCNECEFRYCCKHDCIVAANNIGGKLNAKYPFCNYDPYVGEWKNKKGE